MDTSAPTQTEQASYDDPLGDLLPYADTDSRWWYWIAAIPVFFGLSVVGGILLVGWFFFDIFLTGGLFTLAATFFLLPVLSLTGFVLTVLYPVATYIDARAVAASESEWTPDPVVWGLVALASVLLSAFTLSVVASLYYLYKRHGAVGTP